MINSKKITYINYTDIGSTKTPKGPETLHIAQALEKEGMLDEIYVRNKVKNIEGIPDYKIKVMGSFIPKVRTFITKYIWSKYPNRAISQTNFDFKVANQIYKKQKKICLFGVAGLPGCASVAKKLIVFATSSHQLTQKRLMEEETGKEYIIPDFDTINFNTYKKADLLLVRSPASKKTFVENGVNPKKIKLIWNGIDLDRFNVVKKKDDVFRVLYVANSGIMKGLQYLLEGWKGLNLPHSELIIAGRMRDDVQDILKQYRGLKNVKYVGQVNPIGYYQQCDVFVLPSLIEGSPMVVLEAMACGKPTICFENTGSPAKKSGFILKNRDVDEIRKKIKFLYYHPKKKEQMGKLARKEAEQFSYDNYTKRIVKYIKEVL